jgi:anaerobic ribonucleoside-triphosphate reductase activating protein
MSQRQNMRLALSNLHYPITSLGPGRRIGFWLQGCSIRCEGCMSRDTWKSVQGKPLEETLTTISPWLRVADGITISGGEPFDQAPALTALLEALRSRFPGDILVYSGYEFPDLEANFSDALLNIDALISGPYDARQATALPLRGSANQQLHMLTSLGRARFSKLWNSTPSHDCPPLDIVTEPNGEIWIAGVPRPGDLKTLEELMAQRGVSILTSAGASGGSR